MLLKPILIFSFFRLKYLKHRLKIWRNWLIYCSKLGHFRLNHLATLILTTKKDHGLPRKTIKLDSFKTQKTHVQMWYIILTGDMVQRPAWGKDQPNNYNGEQNCVVLDGGRGWLWNDVGCNLDYLHWICQHGKVKRNWI